MKIAFPPHPCVDTPPRRIQSLELGVFLLLLVPGLLVGRLVALLPIGFVLFAVATILRDVALVGLIAYFLWRNREHVACVGWTPRLPAREVGLSVLLFVPFAILQFEVLRALRAAGLSGPVAIPRFLLPEGGAEIALATVLVTVVALSEETIFRGYLILRFSAVTRSTAAGVVFSSAAFTLGHTYQGAAGTVAVGVASVVLALVYLWRGSLVAPVVLHFLTDFGGIVLRALVGPGR